MFDRRIVDEISNSKGYSMALFTTFNFEINYFERAILNALFDRNIKKIELFVDADELEKAVLESEDNNLNRKYIVNPIRIKSAFHPKIVLLLGDEKAKLIVSSANIKTSGYTLNNEIYNVFEYSKENQDNINLINDAITFFERLNSMSYYQDEKIFDKINDLIYRHRRTNNNDIKLIQNLDESVIDQLKQIIMDNVVSIDIAVPYYDNELLGYTDLLKAFNCNNINLYLQNGLSTFPIDFNIKNKIVNFDNIHTYLRLKNNGKKNFYHGKVFRINTNNKSYILYGSSNCTMSALSKTYHNGGNVECNVLEEGRKGDFDYFFDNFEIELFEEITCNILEFEPKEKKNFSFKYGLKKDEIVLFLSYKEKKDNIKIQICEKDNIKIQKEFIYKYNDNELELTLDKLISDELNNVFDLIITYGNVREVIRCWYFDIDTIENYRNFERVSSFENINIDGDMEKYREHIELIVKTLAFTKDEYSEQIKIQKMLNKKSDFETQEDLDEDEIDDDFIVEKDIPDEYIRKNKDFTNAYIKSKLFSDRFFMGLKLKGERKISLSSTQTEGKRKERKATPAEKRFEGFIKSRVKGILRDEYIDLVDYEHYKRNVGVIFDVINEYKYKEHVKDIFDDEYVIKISIELIKRLLEKESMNFDDKEKDSTIILALIVVIENHITSNVENESRIEFKNKSIIKRLNQLFKIREDFEELLEYAVNNINQKISNIDYDTAKNYIESLFGYRTDKQLRDILKNVYGEESIISIDDNNFIIKTSTDNIRNYLNLNMNSIREIRKNFENNNIKLDNINIIIKNLKTDNLSSGDPINILEFILDIRSRKYYRKIIRRSGVEEKRKIEKLSF